MALDPDKPMYPRPLFPSSREVVFREDRPHLIASRDGNDDLLGRGVEARVVVGEEEDDSLEVIFSAETGAGRAHTPQRMNRTHTPQRTRSSSLLHTASTPVQTSGACRHEGDTPRQPPGRRKQRRWNNDKLIGVERHLRGRHANDETEAEHLSLLVPRRSSLSVLMSDQNDLANAAELRESLRKGLQPRTVASGRESSSRVGHRRRFAGGKWGDAEERFLLVERRLRDILVRALRDPVILSFVVGLEDLLDASAKQPLVAGPVEVPKALGAALAARPSVELYTAAGRGRVSAVTSTLLVPIGSSPFHRLLLHGLCQYRRLKSKSEETADGRTVRVTLSPTPSASVSIPSASLAEFVLHTRLQDPAASIVRDSCRPKVSSQPSASTPAPTCTIGVEAA